MSENQASHALVRRKLIAARLKDRESVADAMVGLMNRLIYYNSLMTNHDTDRGSSYCTDFAIGYLGMINEALVYSYTGEVEILPALPTSGFNEGIIKGIRLRTRAVIENLSWSISNGKASVTIKSDVDQTISVSYGLSSETRNISIKAGQSVTVDFNIQTNLKNLRYGLLSQDFKISRKKIKLFFYFSEHFLINRSI